ncbi:MAG TPA: acetyl-CoA C-acyltransferase FadI [Myxococcales bacterium]|jgi:acetyl-CoA acyltransferase
MANGGIGTSGRRVAIVMGLRTPFVKSGTGFADLSAVDLGTAVVSELVQRSEIDPREVQSLVFGEVVPAPLDTLIAREVALRSNLPKSVEAHTVSRACATSVQAMASCHDAIVLGRCEVAIAGGAESLSDAPLFASRPLAKALIEASRGKTMAAKLGAFRRLKLKDMAPTPPSIKEPTTGLTMGESAEKMARENGIKREDQDRLAFESHRRASAAIESGKFKDEVMAVSVPPKYRTVVAEDNIVRKDATLEALSGLRPVFDKRNGTITAGNSSPLTDGAAALLMMSEEKAKALGYTPLGFLRSFAFAAIDPADQLLMGPAWSTPVALERARLKLKDMDLVDMHEAFAAQVLSNLQAFASREFAQKRLGRDEAIGEVDPGRLNVNGGSIALGHPFAATGARMVTQTLRELGRRGGQYALLTICAAGGMGASVVLERT